MTIRRARAVLVPLLLAPLLALATPVLASPGTVPTLGPTKAAWFDASYPTTTPNEPPPPPGVSADDLYVAGATVPASGLPPPVPAPAGDAIGTVRQVSALAALSFTVPAGSTPASLTLELASRPSTASTGNRLPTGVTLEACPASPTFAAGGHQAFDRVPAYDCTGRTSLSNLSSDGKSVVFSDIARVARGKVLSLVIRPGTLGADRLVFTKPGSHAVTLLAFDQAPVLGPSGGLVPPVDPAPGTPSLAPPATSVPVSPSAAGPPALPGLAGPSLPPVPASTSSPQVAPAASAPRTTVAAALDDTRVRVLSLAGLALLFATTALLAFTDRRPAEPQEWGFGRYRGPRQGVAPTL